MFILSKKVGENLIHFALQPKKAAESGLQALQHADCWVQSLQDVQSVVLGQQCASLDSLQQN